MADQIRTGGRYERLDAGILAVVGGIESFVHVAAAALVVVRLDT